MGKKYNVKDNIIKVTNWILTVVGSKYPEIHEIMNPIIKGKMIIPNGARSHFMSLGKAASQWILWISSAD